MFSHISKFQAKVKVFLISSVACKTTDAESYDDGYPVPDQNTVCLFPFTSSGVDHFNCTNSGMENPEDFWCVTNYTTFNEVDYQYGWGLCNDACPKQPEFEPKPQEGDVTVSGNTFN